MNDSSRLLWLPVLLFAAVALGVASQRFGSTRAESPILPDAVRSEPDGRPPSAGERTPSPSVPAEAPATGSGAARPRAIDDELVRDLDARVEKALQRVAKESGGKASGARCQVSYRVVDRESGVVLAEREPLVPVEPASNMKVVTSVATLLALGADWCFETEVEAGGTIAEGVLDGDLVVRAGGDPIYSDEGGAKAQEALAALAREVAKAGFARVRGDLVLDQTGFVAPEVGPGWPSPNLYWTSSYALAAPLSLQAGVPVVHVDPGGAGELCGVRLEPWPCGLELDAQLAGSAKPVNDVRLGVMDARRELRVRGEYGVRYGHTSFDFRHPAPVEMFADAFREELRQAGVVIEGRDREAWGTPVGRRLATLRSPWIDLLAPVNTNSNNSLADALLIALGHERYGVGSREQGARAVREVLAGELGVDLAGFVQADGSGLSRDNRVHAQLLSEVLLRVAEVGGEIAARFQDSLAIAGETGTLDDRMRDGPARGRVRAKTGWIQGASSLSGFVEAAGGRELVFSILVNYPRVHGLNNTVWKPMQDDLCERLVRVGGGRVR